MTGVRCVRDAATGLGKGFAFVELADAAGLGAALAKHGTLLGGRPLRVTRAGAGGGGSGARGGRGRGRGRGGGDRGSALAASARSPAAWQGVRTKGAKTVARATAGTAPRSARGGGGGGSARTSPARKPGAGGKRPAVAARKAAAKKAK